MGLGVRVAVNGDKGAIGGFKQGAGIATGPESAIDHHLTGLRTQSLDLPHSEEPEYAEPKSGARFVAAFLRRPHLSLL
jgi:hypothetical protein